MKLYTEEQVKLLINALNDIKNWDEELEDEWEDCGYRAIDALNEFSDKDAIELPSDEDIEKQTKYFMFEKNKEVFYNGAEWMKEQILNQNK